MSPEHEARYCVWLRERHPGSWRHYLSWLRTLRRAVADRVEASDDELRSWIDGYTGESRRAARKGLRKYLQWTQTDGIAVETTPALQKHVPSRTLPPTAAEHLRRRASGAVKDRQIFTMLALYQHTALPASAIGQLRFEHLSDEAMQITWRGQTVTLSDESRLILRRWLRVRERLSSLPEEQRRHRRPDAWTHSEFVFPNAQGGPSGYGVIWRAAQVSSSDVTLDESSGIFATNR